MPKRTHGISTSISKDWKNKYKRNRKFWNNKNEFEKVGALMERLDTMKDSRRSNCYWGMDGGEFESWDDEWDYEMKFWNMWHGAQDDENPQPNLKSQFVFNAVETAMTEMYDLNLMPGVLPWTKKGERLAPIAENIIKYPIIKNQLNHVWLDAFHEALILGNSFLKVGYKKVVRNVKIKKLKNFTKEELKALENDNIAIYQDKELVEYNDVDWEHLSVYEYYPDPFARHQHGRNKAAIDGIYERTIGYEAFKAEFGGRKEFVNIDKVEPGYEITDGNPLFAFPESYHETDNVVVLEWEDKIKDTVCYVANGVFIGEKPLDNHKQLSTVHLKMTDIPHQYYGMGLSRTLEGLQAEDEVIRNKFLELLELNLAPPIIANNQVAGEFKDQYEVAKYQTGEIISISGNPSEIQFMAPAINKLSEVLGLRAQIREDAISVSLIDPKASAMPTNSPTAFEAMSLQTATMKSFAKVLKSFARSMKHGLDIQWELQKQEYLLHLEPEQREKRKGDKAKLPATTKSREIYLKDVQIIDKNGTIEVRKKPGQTYPFEIKDDYLDMDSNDIDIIISPESMQPQSKIARTKRAEDAMTQFMPILMQARQDPTLLQDPAIVSLLKFYAETHNLDVDEVLPGEDEAEEDQIERAIEQEGLMYAQAKMDPGEQIKPVVGQFNEPVQHRIQHLKSMNAINKLIQEKESRLDELQMELTSDQPEQVVQDGMDMMTGAPTGGPSVDPVNVPPPLPPERRMELEKASEELIDEIELYNRYFVQLKEHYEVDKMSVEEASEVLLAVEAGVAPPPSAMPAMGPGPMMGEMPPGGGAPMAPPQGQIPPVQGPPGIAPQSTGEMQMQAL